MSEIYRHVLGMQNKFRGYIDQPNHEVAVQLKTEIQRLADEIEIAKNPRSLEERVKSIMHYLEEAEHAAIMDNRHINDLHEDCKELQQALRKLM